MDQRIKTLVLLLLAGAIALSLAAHFYAVFPFDLRITHELQEARNPAFIFVMEGLSGIGDTETGFVMAGAVAAFFVVRRRKLEAGFILLTLSNFVLTSFVKLLVARPRPPNFLANPADIFQPINQYSFPSGHVLFFIVFFGFVAYLAWLNLVGYLRVLVIALCAAFILLIGPSRVYVGAHWASDVLGGYLIGVLWLSLIILAYQLASPSGDTLLKENRM